MRSLSLALLVLALAPTGGFATPAFVQSATLDSGASTTHNLAYSGAVTAGSTLVAFCRNTNSGIAISSASDSVNGAWTAIPNAAQTIPTGPRINGFYFIGTGAGTPTVTITLGSSDECRMHIAEYSDSGTLVDSDGSALSSADPQTCTNSTATAANQMLVGFIGRLNTGAIGPNNSETERGDLGRSQHEDKLTAGSGSVAASWDLNTADPAACAQLILAPAASAPTFDTGVAYVSATATAMTISFDASADADDYYCGLYVGGATPTAAQVKAGTGAHGTATGTPTGSSQQVAITSTDSPVFPYYEPHCVLENTAGLSAVSDATGSLAATPMAAPATCGAASDEQCQFTLLTSVGMSSPCADFNTAVDPDIAANDILVAPVAVQPLGLPDGALVITAACGFSYSNSFDRQSALNVLIFDESADDYMAEDIDFWSNNQLPVCENASKNVKVDRAFSFDITSLCEDDDDQLSDLTVTEDTDPTITGLSFSDPDVTGIATVVDQTGTGQYTVTDVPGDQDSLDVMYRVISLAGGGGRLRLGLFLRL